MSDQRKEAEILRITATQRFKEDGSPSALVLVGKYDTDQPEEIIDILYDICDAFGLYCISKEKAEDLGLLDDD